MGPSSRTLWTPPAPPPQTWRVPGLPATGRLKDAGFRREERRRRSASGAGGRTRRPRRGPPNTGIPLLRRRGGDARVAPRGASRTNALRGWCRLRRCVLVVAGVRQARSEPSRACARTDAGRLVGRSRAQRRTRAPASQPAAPPWFRVSCRRGLGGGG